MPIETHPPLSEPLVLVGTYRKEQLDKWVLPKGLYNYPIDDEQDSLDLSLFANVKELWLFNGRKGQRTFVAEFLGILDRGELKGYPAGKANLTVRSISSSRLSKSMGRRWRTRPSLFVPGTLRLVRHRWPHKSAKR